jgi:hypothetical protein
MIFEHALGRTFQPQICRGFAQLGPVAVALNTFHRRHRWINRRATTASTLVLSSFRHLTIAASYGARRVSQGAAGSRLRRILASRLTRQRSLCIVLAQDRDCCVEDVAVEEEEDGKADLRGTRREETKTFGKKPRNSLNTREKAQEFL